MYSIRNNRYFVVKSTAITNKKDFNTRVQETEDHSYQENKVRSSLKHH